MQIHIKTLIKPLYFAWFFAMTTLLWFLVAILYRHDGKERVRYVINEMTYLKDRQAVNAIISSRDKYLKVTTFYSKVIALYGRKYHPKNKPEIQGLNKHQKDDFIRETYELSELLSIPVMDMLVVAKEESTFNPIARTTWPDGAIKEAGIFQNRRSAVAQAKIYYDQLPEIYKKRCAFYFTKMEDLFVVINAVRIEALLFWGSRRDYKNNPAWYVSSVHWGIARMAKYYHSGMLPPRKFEFKTATMKKDVRSPFTYYFVWNENVSQFMRFDVNINIDIGWYDKYKKQSKKYENQFIEGWKYVGDMVRLAEEIADDKVEFEKKREKDIAKILKKAERVDAKYKEIYGLMKEGRFRNLRDLLRPAKAHFKELRDELKKEAKTKKEKIIVVIYISLLIVIVMLSAIGIASFFIKVIGLMKHKYEHGNCSREWELKKIGEKL